MNDNTPQAAAERDGAILDAQLDKECKRIANAVMEIGRGVEMPMPRTHHAIFQWFSDGQWFSSLIEDPLLLKYFVGDCVKKKQPYFITLLHPESGNAREQRLADERREKFDAEND